MKKFLIVLLALILMLAGIFFYRGGHHALVLADSLDDWLDADCADQTLTVEYRDSCLSMDTFWTEHADERIFGLSAEGITAYLRGRDLYFDTGKAYALPEMPELKQSLHRLSMGLFLYGRVTKNGDIYRISMKTKELDLDISTDRAFRNVTINASLSDGTMIDATLSSKDPVLHTIPQPVLETMSRSEPPMSLTEPLAVLLPAVENLLPLAGDLKLGVSCGILELSETVQLTIRDGRAALTRKDIRLDLPVDLSNMPPVAMAALLLREGEFTRTEDGAVFAVNLPAEAATELLGTLVPQASELGITLGESALDLYFAADRLDCASVKAEGSVPFLFTTIPVEFSAELTIS